MEDPYKPLMELSQADTTEVMALAQHYISLLEEGDRSAAFDMLTYLDGDSIVPMPSYLRRGMEVLYRRFPTTGPEVRYTIDRLVFHTEKDSEVKYTVKFFDRKPGDTRPNQMSFILKPVRRDGKWYLTVADSQSSTQRKVTEIEH